MFYLLLGLALTFDFLNGFHDSSNVVATVISSNALRPRLALLLAAAGHFVAPFLFGVAVATAIGDDLLDVRILQVGVINAALGAAILWNLITWYFGIPSSSSHALVGGLLGAAIYVDGPGVVILPGLLLVLTALFLSPLLGMAAGYLSMRILLLALRNATPAANTLLRRAQVITLTALALSHGTNDAQKTMGVIAMGMVASGMLDSFTVPLWVIAASAAAIALGTFFGGWRLIRTLGGKIYPNPPGPCFRLPGLRRGGDPRSCCAGRAGQHNAGNEFLDHGRGRCRPDQDGALGGAPGDGHRLDPDHPCYSGAGGVDLLHQ